MERKARSESILRGEDVPINQYLPVIETVGESKRRSSDEVALRTIALLVVAVKAEEPGDQQLIDGLIAKYALDDVLTLNEKRFIARRVPTMHERAQFSWQYEAAWVLLWALGYIEGDLDRPENTCDVQKAVGTVAGRTREAFLEGASLRPQQEILDQADLIYRYHWAVVDARINDREPPAGLNPGVVYERHYALNWLIGYMDQTWDEISTDT